MIFIKSIYLIINEEVLLLDNLEIENVEKMYNYIDKL